jgi:biopolymer transport protein ExbD
MVLVLIPIFWWTNINLAVLTVVVFYRWRRSAHVLKNRKKQLLIIYVEADNRIRLEKTVAKAQLQEAQKKRVKWNKNSAAEQEKHMY